MPYRILFGVSPLTILDAPSRRSLILGLECSLHMFEPFCFEPHVSYLDTHALPSWFEARASSDIHVSSLPCPWPQASCLQPRSVFSAVHISSLFFSEPMTTDGSRSECLLKTPSCQLSSSSSDRSIHTQETVMSIVYPWVLKDWESTFWGNILHLRGEWQARRKLGGILMVEIWNPQKAFSAILPSFCLVCVILVLCGWTHDLSPRSGADHLELSILQSVHNHTGRQVHHPHWAKPRNFL